MKKRRFSILMCLTLVITIFMTGCGGTNTSKSGKASVDTDSLIFAIPGEPPTLDPHMAADNIADGCLNNQIFDKLIRENYDGTLEPDLAESWEISKDGSEIEFKIKQGIKFHNGDELTVEDVEFSLNRAAESQFTQETASALDHAKIIDDETVLLKFKYPYGPGEIAVSTICIVNKNEVEADPEGYGRKPVGTGAYEFVEQKSGDKIILKRFEDYYRGPAPIKNLEMKIIVDPTTAAIALEKGEVDLLAQPSMEDRDRLMKNDNIQYQEAELLGNNYIAFNNTEGLFADKKMRQAVAHAINKEDMLIGAVEGAGVVIENAIPRECFGYSEDVTGYEHDIEKAKDLLSKAGYPDGLAVELKTMDSILYSKPTEVLQDQLSQIGIDGTVSKMERGAYLADVFENAEYDMTIMSMVYGLTDGDAIYAFFHSDMIDKGENFFRCEIPELDKLLDKGRSSTDPDEREKIYKDVAQLLNDECVLVPLYAYMVGVANNKDLKGVESNSTARYDAFDYSW